MSRRSLPSSTLCTRRQRLALLATGAVAAAGATTVVLPPQSASAVPAAASSSVNAKPVSAVRDQVSALLQAKAQGKRVEVTDARTQTATTWANPDGTMSTDIALSPVRVQGHDGSWEPVDYDLAPVAGGLAPKASPAEVVFSDGGPGPAAVITKSGKSLRLVWPGRLPVPTVSGPTATYQLDAASQLVLTATPDGLDESFVLTQAPTDVSTLSRLHLRMQLQGLSVKSAAAIDGGANAGPGGDSPGQVELVDAKGHSTLRVGQTVVHDAQADASGEPVHEVGLASTVTTLPSGGQALGFAQADGATPAALDAFVADPSTVYPVTIDPPITSSVTRDTWIRQNDTASHGGDYKLQIGQDSSLNERRALIHFDLSGVNVRPADITSAVMYVYQTVGATCTAQPTEAWPVTGYWDSGYTWGNRPTVSSSNVGSSSFSHGYSSSCPNGFGSIDITNMMRGWIAGTIPDEGVELRAGNESSQTQAKTVCSHNPSSTAPGSCNTSAHVPYMTVTWNSYPDAPFTNIPYQTADNGDQALTTTTPFLSASAGNYTGGSLTEHFTVVHDPASQFAGESDSTNWSGSVPISNYGSAGLYVPAGVLTAHHHYDISMSTSVTTDAGGTDSGPVVTSGPYDIDPSPAAATINCPSYPASTWTAQPTTPANCTLSGPADITGFYYSWDNPNPATWIDASNGTASVAPPSTVGQHKLYAQAVDEFHHAAFTTNYTADIGVGALMTPADKTLTQTRVPLTAQSAPGASGFNDVTYQYRIGTTGSFTSVPAADVTVASTSSTLSGWPQTGTSTGSPAHEDYAELDWNLAHTVHAAGGGDGPVQVQACFDNSGGTPTCTNINTVTLNAASFAASAATQPLGPGTVSLDTGDFEVTAGDASEAGMSVGRTATSLRMTSGANAPANNTVNTTAPTAIFGPGWQATLPGGDIGAADDTLTDNSNTGYLTLTGSDGDSEIYQAAAGTSGPTATYTGLGDANDNSTIKCDTTTGTGAGASCTSWTLTEADGTTTTWTNPNAQPVWTVAKVIAAGSAATNTTSFTRDSTGRVTRILAPVPSGVTCGAGTSGLVAGCQALSLTYAAATTATGTSTSTWGDYQGLVSGISYTAYDPASSAMKTVQVAAYSYDNTGHLRASWDPRISPALKSTYDYDSAGRLIHITPPGRAQWTVGYDDQGRVTSVSRPDPANGTATQKVAYDVALTPATGANAPDLSSNKTSTWGQSVDLPVAGAAVFPASHDPGAADGHGDYNPGSDDWPYADLSYTDVNGRLVDHAAYGAGGWQIDSTRYDINGNTTWSLTALGRARALESNYANDADLDPLVQAQAASADRANMLATYSIYYTDAAGNPTPDVFYTYGPVHRAALASGSVASVRSTSEYLYDQNAPTGLCPCHLQSLVVDWPMLYGSGTSSSEARYKVLSYAPVDGSSTTGATSGWVLRQPTQVTTYMTGNTASSSDLVTKTIYNAQGQIVSSSLPGSSGSDAGTTKTTYYTADTSSGVTACNNHPEWAGLTCQTGPAAQPAGSPIPASVTTYGLYLHPATVTQTSGSSTRTTTTTYDAGERPTGTAITATPAADAGTPVPATTTAYDPATGDPVTVTAGSGASATTITKTFNSIGEQTSYTDADGNTTTSTYDIDGHPKTVNDGKGTTTYTWNGTDAAGNTEHRGLLTALDTGMTSTGSGFAGSKFTGAYDADGNLVNETYPNGVVAKTSLDDTGDPRSLTYTQTTSQGTSQLLSYSSTVDAFGDTVSQTSPSSSQVFSYDRAGRLTQTIDDYQKSCVTRSYGFAGASGMDSDRTSLTTTAAAPETSTGVCPAGSGGTTVNDTFDTADRITSTGYSYDNFGRTLTLPAAGLANNGTTSGGQLTVGYYANDMVATQTQAGANATLSKSFTLDPGMRLRGATDTTTPTGGTATETRRTLNHYSDDTDSPAWIATSTDTGSTWTWERNVTGIDGNLAALQESDTTKVPELQLTNLHGDITATIPDVTGAAATDSTTDPTEFGVPRNPAAAQARYGWVGGKRRSSDDLADLVLMGVRLYNPATGRFLSVDPVPGGNANAYTYPLNPVDGFDLSGRFWHPHIPFSKVGWGVVGFLSDKGYVDAATAAFHRQWGTAGHDLLGQGPSYATGRGVTSAAGRWGAVGAHTAIGSAGLAAKTGLRAGASVFTWPVTLAATALDYLHSAPRRGPLRPLKQSVQRRSGVLM